MTESRIALFDDDDVDQIEMGAAHITNEVVGLLHTALAKSGITRRELADRLGIGESRISQVLNGDGNLRLTTIGRFLAAMNFKAELNLRDFEEEPQVREAEDAPRRESVSIWQHSVISGAGSYEAWVVATGVEGARDAVHHTGGLIFDSGTLPEHTFQTSVGHVDFASFSAPWPGISAREDQEPALKREATNA